jgi:hypothetical protein
MSFDPRLDHLVYATPELAASVKEIGARLGVTPTPGGRHPTAGTENFLIGLGPGHYLEIIGPDVAAPPPPRPRSFGIDDLREPRLVTWALAVDDVDGTAARAKAQGFDLGEPRAGSRETPDGTVLRWRLALRPAPWPGDGLVPFLIDWGTTRHPSAVLSQSCELLDMIGRHPEPARVEPWLNAAANARLDLSADTPARLEAVFRTPAGIVRLR